MRFWDIVMAASTQGGGSSGGATELFPDPPLVDVADSTDGWDFANGSPGVLEPSGGTGPGITLTACDDGWACSLIGTDAAEMIANVANGLSIVVALTIEGFVGGSCAVIVKGNSFTTFAPSGNGIVSHTITAGSGSDEGTAFQLTGGVGDPGTFQITHISVTAA